MPADYSYQLIALLQRLEKEVTKLPTVAADFLPRSLLEFTNMDNIALLKVTDGLQFLNELEAKFVSIQANTAYPVIALLTEIRALQAQMEQWYDDNE
jgi:hypothetical protein